VLHAAVPPWAVSCGAVGSTESTVSAAAGAAATRTSAAAATRRQRVHASLLIGVPTEARRVAPDIGATARISPVNYGTWLTPSS
jgi:hypothetical protein